VAWREFWACLRRIFASRQARDNLRQFPPSGASPNSWRGCGPVQRPQGVEADTFDVRSESEASLRARNLPIAVQRAQGSGDVSEGSDRAGPAPRCGLPTGECAGMDGYALQDEGE